jgi:hypothetical protein
MKINSTISHGSPPLFDGENYEVAAIRMTIHLEALDL